MEYKTEKVVGTTFQNIDLAKLDVHFDTRVQNLNQAAPEVKYQGVIVPEPDNPYDKFAKRVYVLIPVPIEEGAGKPMPVGYLKKDSPLYRRLKVNKKRPLFCDINIKLLSTKGLNDEYTIIYQSDSPRFR